MMKPTRRNSSSGQVPKSFAIRAKTGLRRPRHAAIRGRQLGFLTVILFAFAGLTFPAIPVDGTEAPSDLATAINVLLNIPNRLTNLPAAFEAFNEVGKEELPEGTLQSSPDPENDPLPNPTPVVVKELVDQSDEAIYDFRQSIRRDFVKYAGRPDGKLSSTELSRIAADKRLPTDEDSDSYLQNHDQDEDGFLTISEYVPSTVEVAKKQNIKRITECYVKGIPYPTGQAPVESPSAASTQTASLPGTDSGPDAPGSDVPPPIPTPERPGFLTQDEVESRIQDFADRNGFTTSRGPGGRLLVRDKQHRVVRNFPPGVLPNELPRALDSLQRFSERAGGSVDTDAQGMPVVKDSAGNPIPPVDWPPDARPPYLPPEPAPDGPPIPPQPPQPPPPPAPPGEPPPEPPPPEIPASGSGS